MVDALAAQAPIWEPGTKHGYHMRTYGWLVGEIIRRADPQHRSVGTFWREEIADGLGIDFWIGLPEALEPRVARLVPPRDAICARRSRAFGDDLLLARVFSNPGGHFNYDDMWNTRQLHAAELPSSNGIGERARSGPAVRVVHRRGRRARARSTRDDRRDGRRSSGRAARTKC